MAKARIVRSLCLVRRGQEMDEKRAAERAMRRMGFERAMMGELGVVGMSCSDW